MTFLLDRIEEDLNQANAVDLLASQMSTISTHSLPEFGEYLLRWQPNTIRAECMVKLTLIQNWGRFESLEGFDLMCIMATAYKTHPDYQEDWPS